jgi:dolichyl-phosphate-mannose--protein O-mannosyl transferase
MLGWYKKSFYDTDFRKTLLPLALSGISFGLATASKWTGIYAGGGLAVIFALGMYKRYREYCYAAKNPKGETNKIKHEYVTDVFPKYAKRTILFCVLFFVLIPCVIYLLSYIPYAAANGTGFAGVIKNQSDMFNYHSNVTETHSFSSPWYKWPIMYRPIWYYSCVFSDKIKAGISAFGNPLVWWTGIPALFYTVYCAIKKKDKNAAFLAIGYSAELLPWIPVTRVTFIYHYFPCVPFVALMLAYCAQKLLPKKHRTAIMTAYAVAAIILFVMFYPVISGRPVSADYVQKFLKWSSQWVLLSGLS